MDPRWLRRRKHFFVLTDAGKPVYVRYGDENALAGFCAALAAIASVAARATAASDDDHGGGGSGDPDDDDVLRSVTFGAGRTMVFLVHGPLIFVAISGAGEPPAALTRQLCTFRRAIVALLTDAVVRALARSSRFDAGGLLRDPTVDAVLGTLAHDCTWDPGAFAGAWAPLPFPAAREPPRGTPSPRGFARSRRRDRRLDPPRGAPSGAPSGVVFGGVGGGAIAGLVLTKHHVVTIAHPRRAPGLDPEDVATAARFVRAGESFKTNDESFCPTCLPGKNPGAWCYLYVAWIGSDTTTPNGGAENEGDSHAATTRPNDDDASGERGRARGGGGGEGDDVETAGARTDGAAAEARRRDSLSTCVVFLCSRPDAFEDAEARARDRGGAAQAPRDAGEDPRRGSDPRRGGRAGEDPPPPTPTTRRGDANPNANSGGEAGANERANERANNSGDPKAPNSPPGTNAPSPSRRLASPPPSPPPRGPEEDPGSDHPDPGAGSLGGGPVFSTSPNNVSRSSLGGAFLPSSALRKKPPGVGETRPGSVSLARHVPRAAGGGGGYSTPPGRSGPRGRASTARCFISCTSGLRSGSSSPRTGLRPSTTRRRRRRCSGRTSACWWVRGGRSGSRAAPRRRTSGSRARTRGGDAAGGRRRGAARIRGREYGATAVEEDLLSVVLRRTGI